MSNTVATPPSAEQEHFAVPPPAGVKGCHVRCGGGGSWVGKNALLSYQRHWHAKHAPQPVNPPQEEEQ